VPESFLGDGLVYEELLPVAWTPGSAAEGLAARPPERRQPAVARRRSLAGRSAGHEALKDESPALLHELQRLEYKINILLRLTAELACAAAGCRRPSGCASSHAHWSGSGARPGRPMPRGCSRSTSIRIAAAGEDSRVRRRLEWGIDGARATQLRFVGLSEAVVDCSTNSSSGITDAWSPAQNTPARKAEALPKDIKPQPYLREAPTVFAGLLPTAFLSSSSVSMNSTRTLIELCQRVRREA
jgi:hypothetical protein